ncbi:hypothetical protein LMG23992_00242 [Cupriavidus laharis]|uniref:DNA primase/polymerase bifunctional N-terminal domain-containing protein n=1 Tax=Cupriavidus laharis TaxID=151654 RepID=A0ABM8WCW0_9BURK|nr:DUF3631 domain-containing protein [Cupriavidus laharis]CAG9165095.1 hypothetical protein LMG23992_00242 [Cupriavidus laharis]
MYGNESYGDLFSGAAGAPLPTAHPTSIALTAQVLGEAIARYAARGWATFPLSPSKKMPACPHGHLDARADLVPVLNLFLASIEARYVAGYFDALKRRKDAGKGTPEYEAAEADVRRLWGDAQARADGHGIAQATDPIGAFVCAVGRRAVPNLAVATGAPSGGACVLDIDEKDGKHGGATLAALEAQHGAVPTSHSVTTASGGRHLWLDGGGAPLPCTSGILGNGLDTRGTGGFVVAWPSVVNGRQYSRVDDGPLPTLPQWLFDLAGARRSTGAVDTLPDHLRGFDGQSNDDLTAGVGRGWPEIDEKIEQVRAMLAVLPADDRTEWRDMIMAVKSLNWQCGEELAREWSKKSAKYTDAGFDQLWHSITPGGNGAGKPITIRTLVQAAQAAGWTPPRYAPADASSSVQSVSATVSAEADVARLAAMPQDAMIAALAKLGKLDYDRVRTPLAERLGVRVGTIDDEVEAARGGAGDSGASKPITFEQVESWPVPVDGAALLTDIADTLRRYIVCDAEAADAGALWIVMTYMMDMVQVAPLLLITAPEKRCGKTQLLSLVSRLSARPLPTSSITVAALFRTVEQYGPTLLIDEVDAFMRDNEELRGIVNSGHTRDTAAVIRTVGDNHIPTSFSTWCAKALAGIGRLHGTIMDRAVVLPLRRKKVSEKVASLRRADRAVFEQLRRCITRWVSDNATAATRFDPPDLDGLDDRALDNWEPLRQIAQAAGGDWPHRAARAALALSGQAADASNEGRGVELLTAIRSVFDQRQANGHKHADRIPSADLAMALTQDDEGPWATYNRGKPITANQIAKRLSEFGIKSTSVYLGGKDRPKGYMRGMFTTCWELYLPSPQSSNALGANGAQNVSEGHTLSLELSKNTHPAATPLKANTGAGFEVAAGVFSTPGFDGAATPKSATSKALSGVAAAKAKIGGSGIRGMPSESSNDMFAEMRQEQERRKKRPG